MWAEVGRSRQSVEDSRLLSFDLKLNIITCLLLASCPYRTQQSRPSLLLPMVMLLCTMLQVLDLARRSSLTALSFADPDFGDNPICSLRLGHVKNLGGSSDPENDLCNAYMFHSYNEYRSCWPGFWWLPHVCRYSEVQLPDIHPLPPAKVAGVQMWRQRCCRQKQPEGFHQTSAHIWRIAGARPDACGRRGSSSSRSGLCQETSPGINGSYIYQRQRTLKGSRSADNQCCHCNALIAPISFFASLCEVFTTTCVSKHCQWLSDWGIISIRFPCSLSKKWMVGSWDYYCYYFCCCYYCLLPLNCLVFG